MTNTIKLNFGALDSITAFFYNVQTNGQAFRAFRRLNNKIDKERKQAIDDMRAEVERLGGKADAQGHIDWSDAEDKQAEFLDFKQKLFTSSIEFNESFTGQFDLLREMIEKYTGEITPQTSPGFMALEDALGETAQLQGQIDEQANNPEGEE